MSLETPGPAEQHHPGSDIRFRWWNLLLLLPLIMLITALYNRTDPRLFGIPFFYWSQLAFVFVGVISVAVVFAATRNDPTPGGPPLPLPPSPADASEPTPGARS